jgi:hypothetical protein
VTGPIHNVRKLLRFAAAIGLLLAGQTAIAEIDCNMFWRGGLPLPGHPGGPVKCEEYTPGDEADSAVIGGYEYRIFIDTGLEAADLQPQLSWLAEAIDDAVGEYRTIGGSVRFYVFVSALPRPADQDKYVLAAASRGYEDNEPCPIIFYPLGMAQGYEDFQQAVAHEAFHCVQSSRYWPQMSGSSDNHWWLEGTAVYFSNVVYPDYNREWPLSELYEPSESILDQVYATNFFFQDLANSIGRDGIIDLIASMPVTAGQAAQQDALAAFPSMQSLLHQFGEHYLDNAVNDTGLLSVDVKPKPGERVDIDADYSADVSVPAFELVRETLWFAPGNSFRVQVASVEGDGLWSARELEEGSEWGPLPDLVVTDCDAPREYQFLATSAAASADPVNLLELDVDQLPSCGCEKPPYPFDECIVGTWEMQLESLDENLVQLRNNRVQTLPSEGYSRMVITDYGVIAGEHQITHTSVIDMPPAGRQILKHTRSGTYKAHVQNASKFSLMFCGVESDFHSSATMNGAPMQLGPMTQFQQTPDPVFSDVEEYECSKNELKLLRKLPNGQLREYRFNRVF